MCHDKNLADEVAEADLSIVLPMSDRPLVLLLAFEFEDQDLLGAAVRGNGTGDFLPVRRGTHQGVAFIRKHGQHFRKQNSRANVSLDLRDPDYIARSDPKLFSAGLNNGMHGIP